MTLPGWWNSPRSHGSVMPPYLSTFAGQLRMWATSRGCRMVPHMAQRPLLSSLAYRAREAGSGGR